MLTVTIVCARCTLANHVSERFCSDCGLPLGALQPDAEAAYDALEPYEAPEPADPDVARLIVDFVKQTGYDANSSGRGWQIVVPMRLDRKQAVYVGPAGTDAEGRAILSLVSVCGPVNDRDCRSSAQAQRAHRRRTLRHPRPARRGVLRRHREPCRRHAQFHRRRAACSARCRSG